MEKHHPAKGRKGEQEYALVYATDTARQERCNGCRRLIDECVCRPAPFILSGSPVLRVERKGRAGKSVTVIDRLPNNKVHLKALCALLKSTLGCGGTWYVTKGGPGVIELQGDRRAEVLPIIEQYREKNR
ncbi:MAG: translation initiation factor [Bdellovibrionota bacterium]|nr:MAG: translation initiation factor [Bdellovibrionota bacterium]